MKELNEENQKTEIADVITRTGNYIEVHKNTILIVLAAIVVVILAFFGIKKWVVEPRNQHAAEDMFGAQNYFDSGDYEHALNGDETFMGFVDIMDSYKGTKSANLAHYYAGICCLQMAKYDEAIEYFEGYSGSDNYTPALNLMMQGDAEAANGNFEEAANLYVKASKKNPDFIVAPTALFKAGLAYLQLGENDKAIESFQAIKGKYDESTEAQQVDKYIAYAQTLSE